MRLLVKPSFVVCIWILLNTAILRGSAQQPPKQEHNGGVATPEEETGFDEGSYQAPAPSPYRDAADESASMDSEAGPAYRRTITTRKRVVRKRVDSSSKDEASLPGSDAAGTSAQDSSGQSSQPDPGYGAEPSRLTRGAPVRGGKIPPVDSTGHFSESERGEEGAEAPEGTREAAAPAPAPAPPMYRERRSEGEAAQHGEKLPEGPPRATTPPPRGNRRGERESEAEERAVFLDLPEGASIPPQVTRGPGAGAESFARGGADSVDAAAQEGEGLAGKGVGQGQKPGSRVLDTPDGTSVPPGATAVRQGRDAAESSGVGRTKGEQWLSGRSEEGSSEERVQEEEDAEHVPAGADSGPKQASSRKFGGGLFSDSFFSAEAVNQFVKSFNIMGGSHAEGRSAPPPAEGAPAEESAGSDTQGELPEAGRGETHEETRETLEEHPVLQEDALEDISEEPSKELVQWTARFKEMNEMLAADVRSMEDMKQWGDRFHEMVHSMEREVRSLEAMAKWRERFDTMQLSMDAEVKALKAMHMWGQRFQRMASSMGDELKSLQAMRKWSQRFDNMVSYMSAQASRLLQLKADEAKASEEASSQKAKELEEASSQKVEEIEEASSQIAKELEEASSQKVEEIEEASSQEDKELEGASSQEVKDIEEASIQELAEGRNSRKEGTRGRKELEEASSQEVKETSTQDIEETSTQDIAEASTPEIEEASSPGYASKPASRTRPLLGMAAVLPSAGSADPDPLLDLEIDPRVDESPATMQEAAVEESRVTMEEAAVQASPVTMRPPNHTGSGEHQGPGLQVLPKEPRSRLDDLLHQALSVGVDMRKLLSKEDAPLGGRGPNVGDSLESYLASGGGDGSPGEDRRKLLAMSVSGDNTAWSGWENTPQRLNEPRSGPEVQVGRGSGNTYVHRAGGYWTAQRFNKRERPSQRTLPPNFGLGSGEGVGDGPRAGINQHDRIGINKASGWPGRLHHEPRCTKGHCAGEMQVNTDPYPVLGTADRVHLGVQPFVVGVTAYTPNKRAANYQYRNMFRVSSLGCSDGASRCTNADIIFVGRHSLRVGDGFFFEGVLGDDRALLNCQQTSSQFGACDVYFTVDAVGPNNVTASSAKTINTLDGSPDLDVSSALVFKQHTPTAANPHPASAEHDWSYEEHDRIHIFITFSEPVTVVNYPRLKLNLGDHYEQIAEDGYAEFVGGGFGEKKSFWKNNERNPIKSGGPEPETYYDDLYHIHDGGCTLKPNDNYNCARYSGVTRTEDAVVTLRRVHTLEVGDLVIIQGVKGANADLLNKQHTVGAVYSTGTSGESITGYSHTGTGWNQLSFEPPLDLSLEELVFDASKATLGKVNQGVSCRAAGLGKKDEHGNSYCTFSADTIYHSSRLLDRTKYTQELPGQPGELGIGNTGRGATFRTTATQGGPVIATRQHFQYNEERVEQYMDNVLTFEYAVESEGPDDEYDQSQGMLPYYATNQEHLTSDLDYKWMDSLELNGGTIKRACPNTFQVAVITRSVFTVVTVYGKHNYHAGDTVRITGVEGTAYAQQLLNGQHIVQEIGTWGATDVNRPNWDKIWGATPPYGGSTSSFKIDVDTTGLAQNNIQVTLDATQVYRKNFDNNDDVHCSLIDADLTLPKPGDKMKGTHGYYQSLSYNKAIVVGRAYVTNVTSDNTDGTYGYNQGYGVTTGDVTGSVAVPDVVDIKVSFSEPVTASCGEDNDQWTTPQQYPGLTYYVCETIRLVLTTADNSTCSSAASCSQNHNSTTGFAGEEVFPTSFLTPLETDASNVLNFRYVIRRNDNTNDLQYEDRYALAVSGGSHIRRTEDNKLAGLVLPPTVRDVDRCWTPANAAGEVMCTSQTADHFYSLAGQKNINIKASF